MNQEWVLARAVRYGRGQYRLAANELPHLSASLRGIPVSLLLHLFAQGLRWCCAKARFDQQKTFKVQWQLNVLLGKAIEARQLFHERVKPIVHLDKHCGQGG